MMRNNSHITGKLDGSEIAIIGVSCRFPGAKNHLEFWENLRDGKESISRLSDAELLAEGVSRELLKDPNYIKVCPVLEDYDRFDASFFGYSPREAELMDPQHRVFIECAWEALEDAGYNPETYKDPVGVYSGAKTDTYLFNISSNRELLKTLDAFQIALGNDLGCLSTRISYKFNLRGPSYAVHTACSTSLVAVHLACQSLLIDECRMAIAGGVTVNVPHKTGYLFQPGGVVSPDGHCRAFDADAAGTIFGNGVGVVVLKRLEDAINAGDHIYAVIRGSAANNDGSKKASFTAPGVDGQTQVVLEALASAGVDADTISYIEAHGTGTNLGDPIEVTALTNAFRASTDKKKYCAIGSVKSNVGHLDAAAGISSLIKTVLSLKHRMLPPSLHFNKPNPKIDFENSPFYVNTKLTEWKSATGPIRAGVSSFGFGSTNAHVILEEAPKIESSGKSRPWQLLLLSARSKSAMEKATANLVGYLKKNPGVNLPDVAYTLKVGRKTFNHRRMVVCRDVEEAITALETLDVGKTFTGYEERNDKPVVFTFSGEGIQYAPMAQELYETEPEFKKQIDLCAEILKKDGQSILNPSAGKEAEALFAIEYALAKLFMKLGIKPQDMKGQGVGEYVAACLSGAFSLEEALKVAATGEQQVQGLSGGTPNEENLKEKVLLEVGPGQTGLDSAFLMTTLGKLWTAGVQINWNKFYAGEDRDRIPLPTYPFERERYWIDAIEQTQAKAGVQSKNEDVGSWFYVPAWKKAALPDEKTTTSKGKGCWVVFGNTDELSAQVTEKLCGKNRQVVSVSIGEAFSRLGDNEFVINPASREDYSLLFDALLKQNRMPKRVVHLWNITPDGSFGEGVEYFKQCQDKGYYSLIYLAQAFTAAGQPGTLKVFAVSDGLQSVTGKEALQPEKSTLLGACRVIPQEHPEIECRSIDITGAGGNITESLIEEFLAWSPESMVAYREDGRWVQRFETADLEKKDGIPGQLREQGVYVITGGLGGIGLILAEYLAKTVGARLVLTGRSAFPPKEEWKNWLSANGEDHAVSRKIRKLVKIEELGAELLTISADVTDAAQMQKVVAQTSARFGRIHGVIHAAGLTGEGAYSAVQNTGIPESERHFNARVYGPFALKEALKDLELDFCMLTSSLSAILGGLWNAAYSASNIFMDTFVRKQRQAGNSQWMSVNWDSWHYREEGDSSGVGETLAEFAISPAEGMEAFQRIFSGEILPQVIVSTGELQGRLEKWMKSQSQEDEEAGSDGKGMGLTSAVELEQKIGDIWKKVLGVNKLGPNDNFFDLGGNSMSGLQVISEIKSQLGVQITPVTLYEAPTVNALAKYLSPKVIKAGSGVGKSRRAASEKGASSQDIAIVGMALRFPGAKNAREFWDNLANGVESIKFYSDEELEAAGIDSELLSDPNYVKARPIIDNADMFDASFFGYTPREAEVMDPQQRVFLECAWEALENAGYDSARYEGAIGVYAGTSISTYLLGFFGNQEVAKSVGNLQAVIGNDKDSLTTAVSYKLNLKGPAISVQTYCSTSLVAVHMACRSILDGDCDMAMAGGSSIFVPEKSGYLYQAGNILSPDGHCRAFDYESNGTLFGNGVGVVVLKKLEDALEDWDNIYAVIKGSAINNDGSLKVGYTAPSVDGQSKVIAEALKNAGIDAGTIGYIEAHGTGTQMGDPIEITALTKAFRETTDKSQFCAIGSVKTNIGHLDRSAGVAGLIKASLALRHGQIPPSLNFRNPNPKIEFVESPFYVNNQLSQWESGETPRRAGVSALGFGGTNAHVILEEPPAVEGSESSRNQYLLILSARTAAALDAQTQNLAEYLRQNPNISLADVAYTLQVGRRDFSFRRFAVCSDAADAVNVLKSMDPQRVWTGSIEQENMLEEFIIPEQDSDLEKLGKAWMTGVRVEWTALYGDEKRRRIPLPTYPFERQRYWIEAREPSGDSFAKKRKAKVSEWFGIPSWKRTGRLKGRKQGENGSEGSFLVFADTCGVGTEIVSRLKKEGKDVVSVKTGEKYARTSSGEYVINPAQPGHYHRILEELHGENRAPGTVIHLWSCTRDRQGEFTFEQQQNTGFSSLLYLAQAVARQENMGPVGIWAVSNNAQEVSGEEELRPEKATLLGACRIINQENPRLTCRYIDIVLPETGTVKTAEGILTEISMGEADMVVAHRNSYRWIPSAESIEAKQIGDSGAAGVKEKGVYLVTGGLEGVGYQMAEHLARTAQARLVLPGVPGLPPRDTWERYISQSTDGYAEEMKAYAKEKMQRDRVRLEMKEEAENIRLAGDRPAEGLGLLVPPAELDKGLDELCASHLYHYLKSCADIGKGRTYGVEELKGLLRILPKYEKFYNYILMVLEEEGTITREGGTITFEKDGSSYREPSALSAELLAKYPEFKDGLKALGHCAGNYKEALSGDIEAVSVLYPDGSSDMLMAVTENQNRYSNIRLHQKLISDYIAKIEKIHGNKKVRILEVGAGDGKLTWEIVETLRGKNVEYHFTDIGKSFAINGEKKALQDGLGFMKFGVLDISKNAAEQGYEKYSFDVILALDVIHATPNIAETMEHLKKLLVPNGVMLLVEATKPQRWVNMIWGMAEGWWYFSDAEIRQNSPLLSPETWEKVLEKQNFKSACVYPFDKEKRVNADHSLVMAQQHAEVNTADYLAWAQEAMKSDRQTLGARIGNMMRLESYGAEVILSDAEMHEEGQAAALVQDIQSKFGEISGVIYSAGLETAGRNKGLKELDGDELSRKLGIQVKGLTALDAALKGKPLDFALLVSSVASLAGGRENTVETAVSLFMDSFAAKSHQTGNTVWESVNWDYWQLEDGKASPEGQIKKHEGAEAFGYLLTMEQVPQIIVSPRNMELAIAQGNKIKCGQEDASGFGNGVSAQHARPELQSAYVAPQNDTERMIITIWEEVLGIAGIGVKDSFFDLGGDSLQATQFNSRLQKAFNVDLPLQKFFKAPTIEETAAAIEQMKSEQEMADELEILKMLEQLSDEEVEAELQKRS